jgi:hypothetical protein
MATNVMAQVYETLLCSPGMNEVVKIDVRINRKTILLLNTVVEHGLELKDGDQTGLLASLSEETKAELKTFSEDCLTKAGLSELNEKIKGLAAK